jgi:indolepyruvate ferredoxin oxidoreductase beta subunit
MMPSKDERVTKRKPNPDRPKTLRIVFAGTGGQGVITAARLLSEFFVQQGRQVVSGQLHGMAQRGGAVQATVMVDCGISPAIPRGGADIVVGLEPVETARVLPYVSPKTIVFMNTTPVVPFTLSQQFVLGEGPGQYPYVEELQKEIRSAAPNLFAFDATALARRAGAVRTLNVIMLGCLFGSGLLPAEPREFIDTVMKTVPPRLADVNNKAFRLGVDTGQRLHCHEEAR